MLCGGSEDYYGQYFDQLVVIGDWVEFGYFVVVDYFVDLGCQFDVSGDVVVVGVVYCYVVGCLLVDGILYQQVVVVIGVVWQCQWVVDVLCFQVFW